MKRLRSILILAVFVLGIGVCINACRKAFDLASWETAVSAPIIFGNLNLADFIQDDRLIEDNAGLLHVYVNDTLLRIGLDTLIAIPDTTLRNSFVIPFGGVQWTPGIPFYRDTVLTTFNLKDIQLTYAKVRESLFSVQLTNDLKKQILVRYRILSASNNGDTFMLEELVPAKSTFTGDFNLDGYDLDLRGNDGSRVNTIYAYVEAMIDPAETATYIFSAGEKFELENTFKKLVPQYATGFFGQQSTSYADTTAVNILSSISFKKAEISAFDLKLTIDNGIGADLFVTVNRLASYKENQSVELTHSIIGNVQTFGRAINLFQSNPPVKHNQKQFQFNQANSNLNALFELGPEGIYYDLELAINPLGNISLGNDFVYYGHDLSASLEMDIPLRVGFEGLKLRDTFDLNADFEASLYEPLQTGTLTGFITNGYPFASTVQLFMLDGEGNVLDSLTNTDQTISAAIADASGRMVVPTESEVVYLVNKERMENLRLTKAMVITAVLDSYQSQVVEIRDDGFLKFSFVFDAQLLTP